MANDIYLSLLKIAADFEYFCNNCGQLRLSLTGDYECGNCGSKDIIVGPVDSLPKEQLKAEWENKEAR